jgi:hypothetical protein
VEWVEGAVQIVVTSFGRPAVDSKMPGCSWWEWAWHFPVNQ